MSVANGVGLLLAVATVIFLTASLLFPERF